MAGGEAAADTVPLFASGVPGAARTASRAPEGGRSRGASLLARSFGRLMSVDAGYDPSNALVAELVFPEQAELPAGRRAATRDALLERLRATPGVWPREWRTWSPSIP